MTTDFATRFRDLIERDPTLRSMFATRQPRYRYWQTPDGAMYFWTTETLGDDKYASGIYQPYGPGSRSGKAKVTQWRPVRVVHHSTRKAAKARALALFRAAGAKHPEWQAEVQNRHDKRQHTLRLRWSRHTGTWRDEWGPRPEEATR